RELGRDISADPVDPDSDHLISLLGPGSLHVDFASSTANGGNSMYGIPINVVPGTQALVPVVTGSYAAESDPGPAPIPHNPSIEGYYSASTPPSGYTDSGDHHLLIAVRNEVTGGISALWELYQAYFDGTSWYAASTARFDLESGAARFKGWTSGDAAGLPMLPLLTRYDEYANRSMNHALRVTLDVGAIRNYYVWPARHAALSGRFDEGIPFGGRLRLKAAWYEANKASFAGEARAVVDTMYRYGLINADIGGMMFLSGVSDERWNQATLMTLQRIPNVAFEVVKIRPGYSFGGPTCVELGTSAVYAVAHYPPDDTAFTNNHYPQEDGVGLQNIDRMVRLTTGSPTGAFVYTPRVAGDHTLTVDQAGEYMMPPPPLRVSVRASCELDAGSPQ
ncbi:MAG TPA: hypothetical protein VIZ30_10290, partial [Pseudomonadales bacterium]